MTDDELQEWWWGDGGWADRIYAMLQRRNAAGYSHVDITLDLNPPERYAFYD